uniref:Cytochrome b5 reductase 4 n=1 Tax=Paramormyrops kingsleyae TaxID=1676925 RepID=A0A3B3QJ09_9TELE
MDWIRLTKSGKDLTGFRGRLIEVTEEELRKHNTRDDCWTCIRGMVYNVSPYMQFHPGGEDELLKAAGVDGTDLFDQVHRWVNYESMLKECLVGRMAAKPSTLIHGSSNTQKINPSVNRLYPSSPSTLLESNLPSSLLPPPTKDHCPRFDWFQTDVTVNITVYTKCKIPTSGITVVDLQGGTLRVEVFLGKLSYLLHLQLSHEVQEHLSVHTASAVGRVQVCMHKVSSGQWAKLGEPLESHDSFLHRKDCALFYRKCVLVSKTHVTHDTSVFHFQMPPGTVMQIPVGEHVYLKTTVKGNKVVKPYTPVDKILMPNSLESTEATADVFLMIKVYPDGVFTQHLCGLNIGDSLAISSPNGSFSLRPLHDITHLYLLAAGTGFTPMARLIRFTLHNVGNLRNTKLMFFNRQESDILWRSELDQLAEMEEKNLEACDKHPGLTSCVVDISHDQGSGSKVCSHSLMEESHSIFRCSINEEEQCEPVAGHQGYQGRLSVRTSSDVQGEPMGLRKDREANFLQHFNIPNFVNSEHSSVLGDDDLLLCEQPIIMDSETRCNSKLDIIS